MKYDTASLDEAMRHVKAMPEGQYIYATARSLERAEKLANELDGEKRQTLIDLVASVRYWKGVTAVLIEKRTAEPTQQSLELVS